MRRRVILATAVLALGLPVAALAQSRPAQPARPHATRLAAAALVPEMNAIRVRHGLRPLRVTRLLAAAARLHSREMGERGYFKHASADGTAFWKRVRRFYGSRGFSYWMVGENLLWSSGSLSASEAVRMWMQSPPHRENLLERRWREVGVSALRVDSAPGVYQGLSVTIVTADFGVRR